MISHRTSITAVVGAAAIWAVSGIAAGPALAADPGLAGECGLDAASWADRSAVFGGKVYRDDDIVETVGWQTELIVRAESAGLTVGGAITYWADKTLAEDNNSIRSAILDRSAAGTYYASTAIYFKAGAGYKIVELAITPHCAVNGDVVALAATIRRDDGSLQRTAHYSLSPLLMRGAPAIETGPENQGKAG